MVLFKIQELDPEFHPLFEGCDVKGLAIYSDVSGEKIGDIKDLVIDETGHFRYLIVELRTGKVSKPTMLPIGRIQLDPKGRYGYALGFTNEEAENLPKLNLNQPLDRNFELQVRRVYRPERSEQITQVSNYRLASVNTAVKIANSKDKTLIAKQPDLSFYLQEPALYQINEYKHAILCPCEERLSAKHQNLRF